MIIWGLFITYPPSAMVEDNHTFLCIIYVIDITEKIVHKHSFIQKERYEVRRAICAYRDT